MKLFFGISCLLLLGSANTALSNLPSSQPVKSQFGGIPVVCHLQEIDREPKKLNQLLDSYLDAKEYTLALQLVETSASNDLKVSVLNRIASSYLEAKQKDKAIPLLSQALQITKSMKKSSAKVEALLKTGNNLITVGRKNQAIEAFSLGVQEVVVLQNTFILPPLPGETADSEDREAKYAIFLTQFAAGYTAAGKYDKAVKLLAQSLGISKTLTDKASKVNLLVDLSIQYEAARQPKKAHNLLVQSLQVAENFADEDQRTNALLSIAIKILDQPDKLAVVMERFVQIALTTKSEFAKNAMLQSAVTLWLSSGQVEEALRVSNIIEDVDNKTQSLNAIASYYLVNHKQKGLQLLNQSLTLAQTIPDSFKRDLALAFITPFYIRASEFDQALQVTEKIQTSASKDFAWLFMIEELVRTSKFDQALQLAARMKKDDRGTGLSLIAIAYAKEKQFQQALDLVKSMDKEYDQTQALIAIANKYLNLRQLESALQTAQLISTVNDKSEILAAIALAYGESAQYSKATQVAQAIPDTTQRNSLIKLLTCANQTRV